MDVIMLAPSMAAIQPLGVVLMAIAAIGGFVHAYLLPQTSKPDFWDTQPRVGQKDEYLSWFRSTFKSITQAQSMVIEGYAKFSKSNIPFAQPSMATGALVILPPSQVRHILSMPEREVESAEPQQEVIQAPYTICDPDIYDNRFHFDVVRRQLSKNLALFTEDIAEELALGFEQYWGTSSEWTTIKAWDSALKIVARAANRVFVGAPLCRDEEFLEHSRKYSMSVFGGGQIIRMLPSILRPVVGQLMGSIGKRHLEICRRKCIPIVEERLRNNERIRSDPTFAWRPPNDALQWVVEACYNTRDPKQLDAARISHRLLLINMVAIHSTSFTMTNTILDLYSSDPENGFVEGLREECDQVLAETGGTWTKDAVSGLVHVDSTIRESMRLSTWGIVGLTRRVSAPGGIKLEGEIHIPKGTLLGVPLHAIHYDEDFYNNASFFDAFRFSRAQKMNQAPNGMANGSTNSGAISSTVSLKDSVTTPGDTFLGFGHGKHPCPGRYFAAHEMKLMLAHVVQKYDVEHLATRPLQEAIMETKLPAQSTKIRIRRRT